MSSPYSAYSRASATVSKTRQVVMLYEGAIRFLQQALESSGGHLALVRYEKLTRAGEIITALQAALDMEHGGALAQGIFDFYASIGGRILGLHRSGHPNEYAHIINELRSMRDMWDAMDRGEQAS